MTEEEFRAAILAHLARIESALACPVTPHRLMPAFYSVTEVRAILGTDGRPMSASEFHTNYLRRFTDTRPVERRVRRVPHRIRRSEVELVVERGWESLAERRAAEAHSGMLKKGKK